mgnify:FL=1
MFIYTRRRPQPARTATAPTQRRAREAPGTRTSVGGPGPVAQLAALQALADSRAAVLQRGNGKKKTTADYLDDYDRYESDEEGGYEDATDELWRDEAAVWDFARRTLAQASYANWDETDSDSGDYCRFIFYLPHEIRVGVNVHYTVGGKVAGNMYIEGIGGWTEPTPLAMVAAAPNARPATTETWR